MHSHHFGNHVAAALDDDIIAHNVYGDDDSGRAPEDLLGEPKVIPEERLAQAEEPKSAPVTMLPAGFSLRSDRR